jgi:predicted small integral membrane protein
MKTGRSFARRGRPSLWGVGCAGLFVSGFLAWPIMHGGPCCGVVCGVWGLGLLFENYIVDASIFEKKQFPRIMNLDLAALLMPFFLGCWGCGWFLWFSREVFF